MLIRGAKREIFRASGSGAGGGKQGLSYGRGLEGWKDGWELSRWNGVEGWREGWKEQSRDGMVEG